MANHDPTEVRRPMLEVWREACRHIEISESAGRIANLLANELPLGLVLVRAFHVHEGLIETVAVGTVGQEPASELSHDEHPAAGLDPLLAWCRAGQSLHDVAERVHSRVPNLIPPRLEGDVLVGPLNGTEGPLGTLILVSRADRGFAEADEALAATLLEPFTVALENDRRIQEMTRLREAAEADKHSLLTKLGRQDVNDTIVGAEAGLKPVMERVEQVAPSDVPVLIFGETGSGKEVIARAIHARSRRASGPFLRVNCGAIPSELIDSELFGHERGSFTGAVGLRKGWFERSDGGTLFLDEVGELPLAAQVRLLRILQDGTFERVGGQRLLKVNVRIVAATHRDLHEMVRDGRFRQDLWYRIAVFPVYLPSLRDRPDDIAAMAEHFALRACRRFGLSPHGPTSEDLALLRAYSWPGNVRELAAVIDRAAILGDGQRLDIAKALGVTPPALTEQSQPVPEQTPPPRSAEGFLSLDEAMARHIESALTLTHGRVEGRYGAARLLKINPHTLRARMRKLKIDWRQYRQDES